MPRYDLTDEQWHCLRPLLPPQRPPTGRPAHDHRTVINGILFVLRGGCAWRDLPDRYGNWKTVSSRFYRWCKQGVWQRVQEDLRQRVDARGGVCKGIGEAGPLVHLQEQFRQINLWQHPAKSVPKVHQ